MIGKLVNLIFYDEEKEKCMEALRACGLPTGDGYWWTRYPKRTVEEVYKMEENTNAILTYKGRQLVWEETLITDFGSIFVISIQTQTNHPFKAPQVFLKEPKIECSEDKHMYRDGSLCLFKPAEYSSNISILEIRNMACSWCFCYEAYRNTGVWPGAEEPH